MLHLVHGRRRTKFLELNKQDRESGTVLSIPNQFVIISYKVYKHAKTGP